MKLILQIRLRLLQLNIPVLVASVLLCAGIVCWGTGLIRGGALSGAPEIRLPAPVIHTLAVPVESPDELHLAQFYSTLGDRSDTETYLQTLFELAAKNGVSLNAGDYQWSYDKETMTYRYRIRLPVKAGYSQIRQLTLAILAELPFAAVDELSFKRDSAEDDTLESTLQLTLYLNDKLPDAGAGK